uniref:peptidylprolyl isomerase n=1 Tax=Fagus sylvatica TaxID=28930 RepID=A0A2N9FNC3_FAGSY
MEATNFKVIVENEEQVELSFTRTWDSSREGKLVPLNIDKRFVMLRGSSGFYSYAIYEHLEEWPAFNIDNTRMVFKLRKDKFNYMAIADNRQRFMPLPEDRLADRGQTLAYPEAVLLVNPVEPEFKGEVDDKYEYGCESKDNRVHGWMCTDPPVGFWQITPSAEFRSAGPLKQFLTSHVGPTTLSVFHSVHYSGEDLVLKFGPNEPWKKVFGPIFIYLNSLTDEDDPNWLWENAKEQMINEVQSWPYDFPASEDFPSSDQRGNVSGRLLVLDRYICEECIPGNGAYVGLAPPGDVGSWQKECKGYQFWTRADENGCFSINNVRTGDYNLYAWVPGVIGDYRYDVVITITSGCKIDIGKLVYEPPRDGPTLWEIGIPNRSAAEFYVPDPNPKYINKLYVNHPDRFRQYGLWERYAELYPDGDLVYIIGTSDYRKDWFFAQVTRKKDDNTYEGTTWQIKFKLDNADESATYKLRIALATAHNSELQVRINDPKANLPLFSSGVIGKENTIARHGIHGLYWLFGIDVPGTQVVEGDNTIFLTQPRSTSPFQGVMYDYIRLEGIEVKPGKPYPYHSDNVQGKLHVTQATLGLGSSKERCVLQCHVGHKSPIFLCSLLPNKNETCPLNLEFESDDLVAFSVIGPQSVHLSGYFEADEGDFIQDDYESDSIEDDSSGTETEDSSEDEYEDGFIDDSDLDMYPPSQVPNSGVVIEEIVDDEKATNGNGQLKRKKKNQSDSEDHRESQQQIVVKSRSSPVLESEDEDGFPVSNKHKSNLNVQKPEAEAEQKEKKATEKTKKMKKAKDGDHDTGLKRKVESVDQDDLPERQKKKQKEQAKEGEALKSGNDAKINVPIEGEKQPEELKRSPNLNQVSSVENDHDQKLPNKKDPGVDLDLVPGENSLEEKKKKKKKKKTTQESEGGTNQTVAAMGNQEVEEKQSEVKSSQMRTYPNGLVIEELAMGKPDGKRASPGKQVSVHYIGKLKSNGKIFDSNVGRAPFKFRLGIGQVIKGWDVGVNGMRIGDKRRLTIPPLMGYGAQRAGKIPPNSWLMFDVELVDVR